MKSIESNVFLPNKLKCNKLYCIATSSNYLEPSKRRYFKVNSNFDMKIDALIRK